MPQSDLVAEMRRAADGWRRPALRQVEGPNDLKIYGGTIADDIDRWADEIERLRKGDDHLAETMRIAMPVDYREWVERHGKGNGEREALRAAFLDAIDPFVQAQQDTTKTWRDFRDEKPAEHEEILPALDAGIDAILARTTPNDTPVASFQSKVQPWLMECFGEMIAGDREERNHRFLEEALELVQSLGCSASEAHQLVDYVYGRPEGDPPQEVGGVMVTLAALCLANDLDMHAAGWVELDRIWGKVEQIRAKQAAKPKHSPLPALPLASAPPLDGEGATADYRIERAFRAGHVSGFDAADSSSRSQASHADDAWADYAERTGGQ